MSPRIARLVTVAVVVMAVAPLRLAAAAPVQSCAGAERTHTADPVDAEADQDRSPACAPAPPAPPPNWFRALGTDLVHLPSKESAVIGGIGLGLALAAHPADRSVNGRLAGTGGLFQAGAIAGNSLTLLGASTLTAALGRAFHRDDLAHLGGDLVRSQLITEAAVQALKFTVRRPRPNGGRTYSFPSGHAAVTFATAAALDRHLSWRVAVPAYALAGYVAASRLHDDVHYLSDVIAGAALGTLVGRTVTRHVVPGVTCLPTPTAGGMAVMCARTSARE